MSQSSYLFTFSLRHKINFYFDTLLVFRRTPLFYNLEMKVYFISTRLSPMDATFSWYSVVETTSRYSLSSVFTAILLEGSGMSHPTLLTDPLRSNIIKMISFIYVLQKVLLSRDNALFHYPIFFIISLSFLLSLNIVFRQFYIFLNIYSFAYLKKTYFAKSATLRAEKRIPSVRETTSYNIFYFIHIYNSVVIV